MRLTRGSSAGVSPIACPRRGWRRVVGPGLLMLLASACGAPLRVTRVVDGRVTEGRFVEPQAYALFLQGSIAEARGQLDEAVVAYEALAKRAGDDAEVWARIARVRCARDPSDPRGRSAVSRALAVDPDDGHAWEAASRCKGGAADASARAARDEPADVALQIAYAKALDKNAKGSAARAVLLAMTLEQPESSAALEALVSWADAHDDVPLLAMALAEAPKRTPRLDAQVARAVVSLAGEGQLAQARGIAAALLDQRARVEHEGPPLDEHVRAVVGRLALDEAIGRADEAAIERRSVAAHLTGSEAAARAVLAGRVELGRDLALRVAHADPADAGARMVLLATGAPDVRAAGALAGPAPTAACLALGQALWRGAGTTAARDALDHAHCDPIAGDDAMTLAVAVDLAARGALDESTLPLEGRIELAWRKQVPMRGPRGAVDLRHELMARALEDPSGARTAEIALKLARRGPADPVVLASLVTIARARGQTLDELARAALTPPATAVLDAALIQALPRTAPERVRVRARFAGLAATPAERALVSSY